MDTKLTLKLDKNVIERAKEYAASQSRSLSGIVESYLSSLIQNESTDDTQEIQISAFVKSISPQIHINPDLDYKSEYSRHLSEKYQ